jgi:RimJ/RimL family protein N-acetyltransferase
MTAEILAATEHLVLRRMTNDDAAALAAYRSDPVQARYQSWETPYPLDSARALIAQMRNVRFAQPGVWLQIGIETSGRLIVDIAVRVDGDQARQATVGFTLAADAQGHGYATESTTHSHLTAVHRARRTPHLRRLRHPQRPLGLTARTRRHAPRGSPPQVSLVER